ncbi:hypothetical protein M0813_23031 [Anaeramoeba flamelloides]|uniref:THH1/TOM1/TOM3 domain-containing protein n=1 Tax=Anaeramoeba flamelloides TaxID=1746091 RepID=A0AAV7YTB3_9EUKA|nr:hypothetical protein M0812_20996 [Anaeramoeba flamelloides]KAJ6241889.1 hypothetical protein M0813_23031 [Anaeramoeba flamelloides]
MEASILTNTIILQISLLFLSLYSLFRLVKLYRSKIYRSYQNLFYWCIFLGCLGLCVNEFWLSLKYYDGMDLKLYYTIAIPFNFIILYSYLLMIPVQAELYYLCKEAKTGKYYNKNKIVRSLHILITIMTLINMVVHFIFYSVEVKKYYIIDPCLMLLATVITIGFWLYYGIQLTRIVKNVAGEVMWNQTRKLFIVEIVWSAMYITTVIIVFLSDSKSRFHPEAKYSWGELIFIYIQKVIPSLLIMVVVFETPKTIKPKELLLVNLNTTSSENEEY